MQRKMSTVQGIYSLFLTRQKEFMLSTEIYHNMGYYLGCFRKGSDNETVL